MTHLRLLILIVFLVLFVGLGTLSAQILVGYNVENFFHPEDDSLRLDDAFTLGGPYHWDENRYFHKAHNLARVITSIQDSTTWTGYPALVALMEVENATCLTDLCHSMHHASYRIIHFDSPDRRGIDVALLYDSLVFFPHITRPLPVMLDSLSSTRDILYVAGEWLNNESIDTTISHILHLFVCHLPSQLGGSAASAWKRDKAKKVLRHAIDSILTITPDASIAVIGDMNSKPMEDLPPLHNYMLTLPRHKGTHRYQGRWTYLDQFYASPALWQKVASVSVYAPEWLLEYDSRYLGYRPLRTFYGFRYRHNSFSDHLPILVTFQQ